MDIHYKIDTNSDSSPPPELEQFQEIIQSSSSIAGRNTDTNIPSLSNLSFRNDPPLLLEHKRRGTAAEYTNAVLDSDTVWHFWYLSVSYLANIISCKVAKDFSSGALTFKTKEGKDEFYQYIRRETEKSKLRWSFYENFVEYKMPESRVYGQALYEVTRILVETILQTYFAAGTSHHASQIRSSQTACMSL